MDVVRVVRLIVALFPDDQEEVDQSNGRDGDELAWVLNGVSGGRAQCPAKGHAQEHPDHLTLCQHLQHCGTEEININKGYIEVCGHRLGMDYVYI